MFGGCVEVWGLEVFDFVVWICVGEGFVEGDVDGEEFGVFGKGGVLEMFGCEIVGCVGVIGDGENFGGVVKVDKEEVEVFVVVKDEDVVWFEIVVGVVVGEEMLVGVKEEVGEFDGFFDVEWVVGEVGVECGCFDVIYYVVV